MSFFHEFGPPDSTRKSNLQVEFTNRFLGPPLRRQFWAFDKFLFVYCIHSRWVSFTNLGPQILFVKATWKWNSRIDSYGPLFEGSFGHLFGHCLSTFWVAWTFENGKWNAKLKRENGMKIENAKWKTTTHVPSARATSITRKRRICNNDIMPRCIHGAPGLRCSLTRTTVDTRCCWRRRRRTLGQKCCWWSWCWWSWGRGSEFLYIQTPDRPPQRLLC